MEASKEQMQLFVSNTSDSIGGSPPASNNRTFQFLFSLKRLATTEPAEPAPTTIKSYSSKPMKRNAKVNVL